MRKRAWYWVMKAFIKTGLFFYFKQIKVVGKENIPSTGAVLFAINHPNGLMDPLIVATNTNRQNHFLVRASVFKNSIIKKFLGTLNLMPVYRIRDGMQSLEKNKQIFEQCSTLFSKGKSILIFPEGSHNHKRTIRPLSKGFTRILFGTLENHPNIDISIIPVGLTYQKIGVFPSRVAIHFGTPISSKKFFEPSGFLKFSKSIKADVAHQLKKLTVHIPCEDYDKVLPTLKTAGIDYTDVENAQLQISNKSFSSIKKTDSSFKKVLYILLLLNSSVPYFIWRHFRNKIKQVEFVDTFRFGSALVLIPAFYGLQAVLIQLCFQGFYGVLYFFASLCLLLVYVKAGR